MAYEDGHPRNLPAEILGRALSDPEFRAQLLSDPESCGVTGEQAEMLKNLDPEEVASWMQNWDEGNVEDGKPVAM